MPRKYKEIVQLIGQTQNQQTPVLDLSKCNLGELLKQVCQMIWLTELNLAHCHISVLPDEIGNLVNLTRLDLSENQLAGLPESITRLSALQSLNLTLSGYNFRLSEPVQEWVDHIKEVTGRSRLRPVSPIVARDVLSADHPNFMLERVKQAMKLYSDAFDMEERGYDGAYIRDRADQEIEQIFKQNNEMPLLFPELYRDFKERRFHRSTPKSEKTLRGNSFRLPAKEDLE